MRLSTWLTTFVECGNPRVFYDKVISSIESVRYLVEVGIFCKCFCSCTIRPRLQALIAASSASIASRINCARLLSVIAGDLIDLVTIPVHRRSKTISR